MQCPVCGDVITVEDGDICPSCSTLVVGLMGCSPLDLVDEDLAGELVDEDLAADDLVAAGGGRR